MSALRRSAALMRSSGALDDPRAACAYDHVAWAGDSFAAFARSVLDAAAPDELLMVVGADPYAGSSELADRDALLADGRLVLVDSGATQQELRRGTFDPVGQIERYSTLVESALAGGYRAVRVVGDNTPVLTADDATVERWLAWEQLVDGWQATVPVTGACWFDETQVDPDRLSRVAALHPVTGGALRPRFRLFADSDERSVLHLRGSLESADAADLRRCVERADAPVVLEMSGVDYVHHRVLLGLAEGPPVRLRDAPPIVQRVWGLLDVRGGALTVA